MKCPKCEYLGFESAERCRNCGYDFSLTVSAAVPDPLDLPLDQFSVEQRFHVDVERSAPASDLPLFGGRTDEMAPLITVPSQPRVPLGVRRATPEVPRARLKTPQLREELLFETHPASTPRLDIQGRPDRSERSDRHGQFDRNDGTRAPASASSRIMAALLDGSLLCVLDATVLYLTLRLCGLTAAGIGELPIVPLLGFLLLLNGGYFVAFTAVGGQSIGKMALGIRVMTENDGAVPVGRATLRTLAYLASALPLGAGFLPGVMGAERLALHDRLAHTRVVRPS